MTFPFPVQMRPAIAGPSGSWTALAAGRPMAAANAFSGGLPLNTRTSFRPLQKAPVFGAMGSAIRPASPPGAAGQGTGRHPNVGIAYMPNTAPAAVVERTPLDVATRILPIIGIVAALGAAGYLAFR